MSGSLTPEQVEHYWREGWVHRIPVLAPEEVEELVRRLEEVEAEQSAQGAWTARDYRPWDQPDHPLLDWIDRLARHPVVLDAVESILGPDILIRNADVFLKEPGLKRGIGWHVDTAVQGPDADRLLTAWIGLSASTVENGGLQFSAGSHRRVYPGGPKDRYTLTFTKETAALLDPADTRSNVMEPGMMSLHHFRTAHRSGPNLSTGRRIAFVGRYMAPAISAETAESGQATLVRGTDRFGHFALKPRFPLTWTM
jgi:ectoine hydroxylase-related dioxygenase (phytanoyl-CoA dioxygenase family)